MRYKILSEISLGAKVYHSQFSGAFSGLLAAAIENMNGIGGRPGWAWILIVVCFGMLLEFLFTPHSVIKEGLFSFVIGLLGFFVVPSTPNDSKFLTENQK